MDEEKIIEDFADCFMKFYRGFLVRGFSDETAADLAKMIMDRLSTAKITKEKLNDL